MRLQTKIAIAFHPTIAAVAITFAGLAVLTLLTPRIAFNDGLGNDGSAYANLTEALRGRSAEPQWAGFAYRLLPSAIVAAMPFDVVTGFLIVNVLSVFGSALLLSRLLERYRVAPRVALLGLLWWVSLPMGARWDIYYPVLGDAFGFLILVALILCTLERRLVLFALALGAGVVARENLLIAVPFLWRAHLRALPVRWTLLVVVVSAPAVAALLAIRAFPPVTPAPGSGALAQTSIVALQIAWIVQNHAGEVWRVLLGAPLSLGLLFVIPLLRPRKTLGFVSREVHWLYLVVLAMVFAAIGGRDTDRYVYVLAPFLLVLTFAIHGDLWQSWPRAAALTALQLVAVRFGWPLGTTESEYLQNMTGFMTLDRLAALALLVGSVSAFAAAVIVWSGKLAARTVYPGGSAPVSTEASVLPADANRSVALEHVDRTPGVGRPDPIVVEGRW